MSHNANQKLDLKHGSQLYKTAFGTSNIYTMGSKNNLVYHVALNCPSHSKQGVKWTYFVNLSMQVKIALQSATTARLVMKSMDHISSQAARIGTGFNNP